MFPLMAQRKTLLLVDDDDDLRGALAEQLALHEEFAVAEAPTAGEGVRMAKELKPDLVLLDVDNGPNFLVYDANAGIYQPDFLTSARQILNPGGALVVWSSDPAPELAAALEEVFGNCTEHRYDVLLQERPEQYLLYLSRVPRDRP